MANLYEICQDPECSYCLNLRRHKGWIKCSKTGRTYQIPRGTTCLTTNLVYCLTCQHCRKQYVGETYRTFRKRCSEHLKDIEHRRDRQLSHHFLNTECSGKEMDFSIIEVIKGEPTCPEVKDLRQTREKYWMWRMRSIRPLGINVRHK